MADGTGISWCDATWNPIRGCSRVSEGFTSKRKSGGVIELPYLDGVQHAAFPRT